MAILLLLILLGAVSLLDLRAYYRSSYYENTHASPLSVRFDLGRLGEYLIWKELKDAEKQGAKFLFNIYIPKGGNETTEIDVLMIAPRGIFVFESKNYSGWIFGSAQSPYWTQTLPAGRGRSQKNKFYSPIMQNRGHIRHLTNLIGELPMYSIVCFSDRCTLKKVPNDLPDVKIIYRRNVCRTVTAICQTIPEPIWETEQIDEIYAKLYPYTQVNASVKEKHISDIKNGM